MILWEADYLFACFLLGLLLILVYDILRIARIVLPHARIAVGIEDVVYWLFVGIAVFVRLYRGNDGIIRWYAVAAVAAAMGIYNGCISRFAVPFVGKLLRIPIDFTAKVLKRIWKKVKIVLRKIKRRWFHGRKKAAKAEKKEKK